MKIALVHDFLREYGGAERVVESMHEMWPEAPLYTSFVDLKTLGDQAYRFKNWDIRPSWVQHNWFVKKFHSPLRFLAPKIWESFDLSAYDVVISSSGWFMCRGVRVEKPAVHICYIHHPPRNLYGYATGSDLQKYWPVRVYAAVINFFLRHYDFETAQRVDYFVANSEETAKRVKKFYRRDSTVIYPPATQAKLAKALRAGQRGIYFLSVGRLTYAKRIDLAIAACNKLKLPFKIVGTGKEETYLRSIAGPTIEFVGGVSDEELSKLYAGAKALIFCALDEDFGIVPVEAMAQGIPVIALGQGGVLETVVDGKTGVIFHEPTVTGLLTAIKQFNTLILDPKVCIAQAEKFNKKRFQKELRAFVSSHTV
jgi:glycosyltransferase involved in cell wall biosynthesis